ncbi:hypothetical protein [Pseudomonas sp. RIT-PI-AD]|uniref:hypothetical protein n=1 Tax=Pseudomonas sp. RIT-PI-AD TaxID=3035294 RepID=UPI0021DAEBB7|nr:hypothetical protein [Pseudomonas sp. RIT-PI-AD]
MTKPLLHALLILPLAGAVLADEPAALGTVQCHALTRIQQPDSSEAREVGLWVEGFLYGVDEELMSADNLIENFDAGQRRAWIGAYCARHPNASVLELAREMARFIDSGRVRRIESISG